MHIGFAPSEACLPGAKAEKVDGRDELAYAPAAPRDIDPGKPLLSSKLSVQFLKFVSTTINTLIINMHSSTLLLALTVGLAFGTDIQGDRSTGQILKRNCYGSGEAWGSDLNTALDKAKDFCNVKPSDFNPGQGFSRCYNLSNTKRVNFNLGLVTSKRRHIGFDECYDGMQKEINGCNKGGRTTYTNWRYKYVGRRDSWIVIMQLNLLPSRADPNQGTC